MRKMLVVGALIVSSVLLLQAPAWAPNLYSATLSSGGLKASPAGRLVGKAPVNATSNCYSKPVTITFKWTNPNFTETKSATSDSAGKFTVTPTHIPRRVNDVEPFVLAATCGGVKMPLSLAFGGAPTAPLLAFGVSLVVAGVLLVLLGRRRGRALG
ncbi:MAG TPA: hypothetical protein VJ966_11820 [Actinomycetes bacterium]|nr:hypothetical protein [Actinomycetes bacterium]